MLAAAPGERLKILRDILGLTQDQLAGLSGVSQPWISEVETSSRDASEDKLRQIAESTGTPLGFFAVAPSSVPLDSLRFRKTARAKKSITRRVHAIYGESFRVAGNLSDAENYPAPSLPYAVGDDDLADTQVEEFAQEARESLRLAPDKPIPHLTRALERAGVAVAPMVLPNDQDEERTAIGHFGVSYWEGLGDPALIGYFPGHQGDRDRFTLAHELGHLVLHTFRPRVAQLQAEAEANRFATALLVPLSRAESELSDRLSLTDYARLKATWGVSIQALIMRGHSIGSIGETRRKSLFVQLSAKGWRRQEPVVVGHEAPKLLWTLLSRRFGPRLLRSIAPTPAGSNSLPSTAARSEHGRKVVSFPGARAALQHG
ncbi:helix-turn-helix domain-containing protein [Micromonospora zhanjiangensis]